MAKMTSTTAPIGKCSLAYSEDRGSTSDESDSDDEFFDALAADKDYSTNTEQDSAKSGGNTIRSESPTKIIDDIMHPLSLNSESLENKTMENVARDDYESSSSSEVLGDDKSGSSLELEKPHPHRTGGNEGVSDSTILEGLKAEEDEKEDTVTTRTEDEMDGGLKVELDEEALKELEEQMTEEEKQARRAEAQTHKTKGNELFKSGDYADSVYAYSQALSLCPLCYKKDRSIMYANRAACKVKQELLESAISDCSKALELNPLYLKVLLRRAQSYELTDKLEDALKDYQQALELDVGCHEARAACMRLPDQIQERNEKLKAEMMSKLKELGNLCLRPFGLSTDNFQLQQDPNTGSYSVNFSQNTGENNGK